MNSQLFHAIEAAMWADDQDLLQDLAPCHCCCHDHTYTTCPARYWNGCKSGLKPGQEYPWNEWGEADPYAVAGEWADYYYKTRGMSRDVFFNYYWTHRRAR